ncbi:MAG: thioesterase [Acidobacteria bacterium]|nr:MAG: thioesterase [Acidobacteriota bacterium]
MTYQPRDPDFEKRVRANFLEQRVMNLIGAELMTVEPGVVEIGIRMRDDLTQQDGFMHAGIVTTVLDSACGYAAYTLMPAGSSVLSVEFKVNLLSPATGDWIVARGEVKRAGKLLTVCTADAIAGGKICATMLATMICPESRADKNLHPKT